MRRCRVIVVPLALALPARYIVACYPVASGGRYTWLRNGADPVPAQAEIAGEVRATLGQVVAGDEITLLDAAERHPARVTFTG